MEVVDFNLLLFPLVGGYYIITRVERLVYTSQRLSDQAIVFNAVIAGIPLILCSFVITSSVTYIFPQYVDSLKNNVFPVKSAYFGTCVLSFFIALGGTWLVNRFMDETTEIVRAIRRTGNELEKLFVRSCQNSELIQITLKNDKVYIGLVELLPKPSKCPYIRLIPFFSGYRNPDKKIIITTDYTEVYAQYIATGKITKIINLDMNLVIEVAEILSANRFDFDVFDQFKK